jgi:hypothetical protein
VRTNGLRIGRATVRRRVARRVRWGGRRNVHSARSEGALCPYPTASTGGILVEVPTRTTRLSQFCHGCGVCVKKPLSQRFHACPCGIGPIQRDLYAAFLAAYLDVSDPDHPLSPSCGQYVIPWQGGEARLVAAHEQVLQRAKEGQILPRSLGVPRAGARRHESQNDSSLGPVAVAPLRWRCNRLEARSVS